MFVLDFYVCLLTKLKCAFRIKQDVCSTRWVRLCNTKSGLWVHSMVRQLNTVLFSSKSSLRGRRATSAGRTWQESCSFTDRTLLPSTCDTSLDVFKTASAACDRACSSGTASTLLRIRRQSAAHRLSITLRSDSLVSMLENTDNIIG